MRQHDPTIHFNPRSLCGERPAAEAIHIRRNFLRLACYLGQKNKPEEITQTLCAPTEIGIQEIHKSHAEAKLLVGEVFARADVPGSLETVD